jgi:predicted GH43/DUF377 family glycosyl hydrolase
MVSSNGVGVGLRTTSDWKTFEKKRDVFSPHIKTVRFLKRKFNDKFCFASSK